MDTSVMTNRKRTRAVAVVQARLGSTRFPAKVLADLGGRRVIEILLDRLSAATSLDSVVVAIPEEDDALALALASSSCEVARGPEDDVLGRYIHALEGKDAEIIVRVTGDCPLVDPALVDSVVSLLRADPRLDYAAVGPTYPDGADCEAVRVGVLQEAAREALLPADREHVTSFIWHQPDRFSVRSLESPIDYGGVRLTLDDPADLGLLRELVGRLGTAPEVGILEYAATVIADPRFKGSWRGIPRDIGLWRSQLADLRRGLPDVKAKTLSRTASETLWCRAQRVFPESTQTLSKAPHQFVRGVTPVFLARGAGPYVWDVDGNQFLDYPMGLGAILLGHAHPAVVKAVRQQVSDGTLFTLPHRLEVEVGELLVDLVPCAEMVRFAKNGSDVTSAAVRLARAVTGRSHVLASGYHGWHDWYAARTVRPAGVPEAVGALVHSFSYNDFPSLQHLVNDVDGEVAAIILEQPGVDPKDGFLLEVRRLADRLGAVLVFDEIVTGFRYAPGGAQEHYGVTPDLACVGKGMGNGMPLSALVGRREVMEGLEDVFVSGTFGGEVASLAAAKATLSLVRAGEVVEPIWRLGARLRKGLDDLIRESGLDLELTGNPPRGGLVFRIDGEESPALRGLFLQETVRRGVLFGGPIFLTPSHSEADVDRTLEVVSEALTTMAQAVYSGDVVGRLEGLAPEALLRPAGAGSSSA